VRYCSKSFRYIEKSNGDKFSPCLTPALQGKYSEEELFEITHDFMFWYIVLMRVKKRPSIPTFINLCQRPVRQTLSKAFEKSIKAQYSFFLFCFKISDNMCKTKILSIVENPFLKPACTGLMIWFNSRKVFNRRFKMHVKSFPMQLRIVMGLYDDGLDASPFFL
jgi:hypothetical protein